MEAIQFKLYVMGRSPRSERAIANLRRLCEELLGGGCQTRIIDVLEQPQLAEEGRILTTPTLVKESPPTRRVVGDLSDMRQVMLALALEPQKMDSV